MYDRFADVYDRMMSETPYDIWFEKLTAYLERQGKTGGHLCELGCGTGEMTGRFAEGGYEVTGIDLSPDMLAVADQKCGGLGVLFLCQDMSRLALLEPADAVVSCLDSVNYVTRPAAVKRTFQRVYKALSPGGLFLFDVKTPLALESADGQTYLDEDDGLFCVWRGEYSPKRRICGYGLDLFVREEDGSWSRGGEYHEEYAYTTVELEDYLREAGFRTVRLYGDKVMSAPREGAERVFFAARKGD